MRYILSAEQMRAIDNYTSESIGISPAVLMERAALACAEVIRGSDFDTSRILIVCGTGNNGADGLALARIIQRTHKPDVYLAGSYKGLNGIVKQQYDSAARSRVRFVSAPDFSSYTLIVDALFGTGLSRELTGIMLDTVNKINASGAKVIAVDIPSGVDATNAEICGAAVKADLTLSFAYAKLGEVLYPGREYCGVLKVCDIGIYKELYEKPLECAYTYTKSDLALIPKRRRYSNKGNYGRALIIAGSESMSGAALLSARAAYKSGCGIVEVFTHKNASEVIRAALPEAIVNEYTSDRVDHAKLFEAITRASSVVIGPGLSQSEIARDILRYTLESAPEGTVIDADALNIISKEQELLPYIKGKIVTPHLGEMSRLTGKSVEKLSHGLIDAACGFSREHECICVLKDTRTIVAAHGEPVFINTAGNSGLAKGGSGDTLTGIIASLISQGIPYAEAARLGVYLHAYAADIAAEEHGEYAMLASDVAEAVGRIMESMSKSAK